ncbi:molybdenum cofactor biosynthesis protein MoaE [Acidiferrobacter sp.]|jgi:molybdopterin synthase catalytic subunit|uniref:molybdenum cofactor biosynthesis protein MoaE n=1 Tax=Acidiferrobacter sp. TaxID=1872107 RepID=UPI002635D78A|nr:molybdenum cofactor biosynthesis protein MoaE [Acidiferrobacter sp.]
MIIRLQTEDFDAEREAQALDVKGAGARVSFVGTVRDTAQDRTITALEIEHYPEMTHAELSRIGASAQARHNLQEVLIIHRYGRLACHERIVLVTVWSAHRAEAFAGCQAIVDALKTRAPFWKKEISPEGALWVPGQTPQDLK